MAKYGAVVFVHGCFWHQHPGCKEASQPKTRPEFWKEKLQKNVARDLRNQRALRKLGWKVIVVWECQVLKNPFAVLRRILREVGRGDGEVNYSTLPDRREILQVAEQRVQWNLRS